MSFFFIGFEDDDDFGGFSCFPCVFGKPKPKKDVDTSKYYKFLRVEKKFKYLMIH